MRAAGDGDAGGDVGSGIFRAMHHLGQVTRHIDAVGDNNFLDRRVAHLDRLLGGDLAGLKNRQDVRAVNPQRQAHIVPPAQQIGRHGPGTVFHRLEQQPTVLGQMHLARDGNDLKPRIDRAGDAGQGPGAIKAVNQVAKGCGRYRWGRHDTTFIFGAGAPEMRICIYLGTICQLNVIIQGRRRRENGQNSNEILDTYTNLSPCFPSPADAC
jgi:hypothetical protein